MYNYQILTSMSKTEIYEKLINLAMDTLDMSLFDTAAYHLMWLFEKMDPEIQNYFFPEKEVKDVQLPENSKL